MRAVVSNQKYAPIFCKYLEDHIGEPGLFDPNECRTIGNVQVNEDGTVEILAVVGFNRWTVHGVDGNIASDKTKRWASKEFISTCYNYAFEYANKTRINFGVRADNKDAIKLHESFGHKLECTLEDGDGEGKDVLIYGLTRKQWRKSKWNVSRINNKLDSEDKV